jgi:signal transduction histidine kinase
LIDLSLGVLVYFKTTLRRRENLIFSILAWASAGWAFSALMVYFAENSAVKLFWGRMAFATSGIIPSGFLIFALLFPGEQRRISIRELVLLAFPALLFIVVSFTDTIVFCLGSGPTVFVYGPIYPVFSVYMTGFIVLGLVFLVKTFKSAFGIGRLQVKYCFLGMFFTSGLGLINNLFLPMAGVSRFNWLGPSSTVIMVGFTTYSIVRHRLMDINLVFKKGTTYFLLMSLLFVPSFLLILLGQKVFLREMDLPYAIFVFSILLLAAFFFYRIKSRAEKAVEQLLFRKHYVYRQTLGTFGKAMVSILDLKSLSERIVETLTQTMGVEKASFFLLDEEKKGYGLRESKKVDLPPGFSFLKKETPLPHYLQRSGEIIVREELIKGSKIPESKEVIDQMTCLEAEVSIPLISKRQLIGMINLSHKFNRDIYSHEDLELLDTLANQMAIAIENARLYEDLKKSKSYIRRADRLASLGILTAGLAHEIRNPLVAIKTFMQLLPERLEDEEFRSHFLKIADGEVDRISSLVNELLEFAKHSDPKLEVEDVNGILNGMILLVSTESKKKDLQVTKNFSLDLPPIKIDREQIKQVFLNILLNAIDATPEDGAISVSTRSFVKPGGAPYVQIEFSDSGEGIPKEHLEEIFNPFFSTKGKGIGLGLSISNQIVQDHNGYIVVESELNQGTSFFVNLPVKQEYQKKRKDDFFKTE